MRISHTSISGVMQVHVSPRTDARGLFARTFCADTFAAHGLATSFPEASTSWNPHLGTLRGLHLQAEPKGEAKLVRATRGRIFDVVVDLRPASPTYLAWTACELDAARRNAIYIPEGCAHGFLTLEPGCEVFYQMSQSYDAELARTYRWDDPAFAIAWPAAPRVISSKDASASELHP
ncbi:dTDP-4-dehydrorhamnose 3,5-epimerase family protein [Roseixanthobacter pseudopolyaromaticivorans]|uniref:dTDP-4-dehydrorhamnose 3,5-epimerase family protein n=1 Tax=Xanthobacteraceae TaxID=335928 RepID=UPI00372A7335